MCTTRIAFNSNCNVEDTRALSRRADNSCQGFPDNLCLADARQEAFLPAMRSIPRYPDRLSWAHNREQIGDGSLSDRTLHGKSSAKGEEYVDA